MATIRTSPRHNIGGVLRLAAAVSAGVGIAYMGSRPHFDDTGVQAGLLVMSAGFLGLMGSDPPWLWALVVGIWTPLAGWLAANPPDPRSKPLPLPWGLTRNSAAQSVATAALILLFPLVGVYLGSWLRWLGSGTSARAE